MSTITRNDSTVRATHGVAGDAERAPRLRLTRRGRIVLTAAAAAPIVAALLFPGLSGTSAVATDTIATAGLEYVTVMQGESLWQLAEYVAPEADPRVVISDIMSLNRLDSGEVEAGARLAIPGKYDF